MRFEVRGVVSCTNCLAHGRGQGDAELLLGFGANTIKLTHLPDRNAVRWETNGKFGLERFQDQPTILASLLMSKMRGR